MDELVFEANKDGGSSRNSSFTDLSRQMDEFGEREARSTERDSKRI